MILEIIRIYIVINYSSDIDVYGVLVCVRLRVLRYLGGVNRTFAVMLYIILWPFILTYINWIDKIVPGIKLNESIKKAVVLIFVLIICNVSLFWLYLFSLTTAKGFVSVVPLGVYVFVSICSRLWIVLIIYVMIRLWINVNYKIILLRLLPIPVFFVKVCYNWILMYIVMIMSLIMML